MSQREAANRLGVDQSTLAWWERGERGPRGVFLGEDGPEAELRRVS